MVMSKQAVEDFLARPLRDSDKAKRFSDDALDSKLRAAGLSFLGKPLRTAQKVCLLLAWKYPRYLILMGMGGGKTRVILDLFRNRKLKGQARRMLVVVPYVVNLREWCLEAEKHVPDVVIEALTMSGKGSRLEALRGSAEVIVVTMQGLGSLCADVVEDEKKGKNKWALDHKQLQESVGSHFDMLVLDESTLVMNHQSFSFRLIKSLAKGTKYFYELTGTPFDKDVEALWSQFLLVDGGYALGETLGLFREAYFRKVKTYWAFEWEFRKLKKDELHRRLRHCSIRYSESECQDLPEAVGGLSGDDLMLLPSVLPKEQQPYYAALEKELHTLEHGQLKAIDSAYTRMRMVTSGWLGTTDEDGERVTIRFKHNPKLDSVIEKLREIPEDEKVLIVHWFNVSGQLVVDRLNKEKKLGKHAWVYGKTSMAQKTAFMDAFRDPKGPRILVASTAIKMGVNLQDACRYTIFFESPDSVIDRKQLEGRTRRESDIKSGSRYFYDAVCLGTKDEPRIRSLREGRRLLDMIVDGKKG